MLTHLRLDGHGERQPCSVGYAEQVPLGVIQRAHQADDIPCTLLGTVMLCLDVCGPVHQLRKTARSESSTAVELVFHGGVLRGHAGAIALVSCAGERRAAVADAPRGHQHQVPVATSMSQPTEPVSYAALIKAGAEPGPALKVQQWCGIRCGHRRTNNDHREFKIAVLGRWMCRWMCRWM